MASYLNIIVIIFTVTLSACAQLLLKIGMSRFDSDPFSGSLTDSIKVLISLPVASGIAIYAFSVLIWLWVLSRVPLSYAYPFVGLSFILTLLFGVSVLNENVNTWRIIGTLLIAAGCVFVAKS